MQVYFRPDQIEVIKKESEKTNKPMAQLIREAVDQKFNLKEE